MNVSWVFLIYLIRNDYYTYINQLFNLSLFNIYFYIGDDLFFNYGIVFLNDCHFIPAYTVYDDIVYKMEEISSAYIFVIFKLKTSIKKCWFSKYNNQHDGEIYFPSKIANQLNEAGQIRDSARNSNNAAERHGEEGLKSEQQKGFHKNWRGSERGNVVINLKHS